MAHVLDSIEMPTFLGVEIFEIITATPNANNPNEPIAFHKFNPKPSVIDFL